jgi:hypothetical protein
LSETEPRVDEALVVSHGLKPDEYARLVKLIGRTPTFTELGIVSAMWNEHCSYKSSRFHLRKLPTKGPHVIYGPGENAGRDRHRRRRRLREEWRTHMMCREIANLTAEMERLDQEAKANTAGFKNKLIDATFAQSDVEADDPLAKLELLLRLTPEERQARKVELKAKVDALRRAIGGGG